MADVDSREVGAVVRLKSGGPKMTVTERVEAKSEGSRVLCRCMFFAFAEGKMSEVLVPEAALDGGVDLEAVTEGGGGNG
jgi:uncharacterized protein YodC (DUF2158 family)